jgi:hypothetical protein
MFIVKIMKYPIYMVYLTIPPTSNTRPTSVVVTSNTLVLVLLASREHAHDMLLVSVLVSEVERKLSNITVWYFFVFSHVPRRYAELLLSAYLFFAGST